ncbi:MAG TPA: CoA-binding protein [Pseudomonadales bacterium]|nr:CoA-binding protein [Pseudomonadales bacterium]
MNIAQYQDPRVIQRIVNTARTVAVVGLSSNPLRPSHFVGFYLLRHGYRVVPVNPREREVLGQRSVERLDQIDGPVDVVDVFREPSVVPQLAEDAIAIGAKALWLQFGVISEVAAERAAAAGLDVVMDRCIKIEHARYVGRMHWLGFNTGVVSARRNVPR